MSASECRPQAAGYGYVDQGGNSDFDIFHLKSRAAPAAASGYGQCEPDAALAHASALHGYGTWAEVPHARAWGNPEDADSVGYVCNPLPLQASSFRTYESIGDKALQNPGHDVPPAWNAPKLFPASTYSSVSCAIGSGSGEPGHTCPPLILSILEE